MARTTKKPYKNLVDKFNSTLILKELPSIIGRLGLLKDESSVTISRWQEMLCYIGADLKATPVNPYTQTLERVTAHLPTIDLIQIGNDKMWMTKGRCTYHFTNFETINPHVKARLAAFGFEFNFSTQYWEKRIETIQEFNTIFSSLEEARKQFIKDNDL